MQPVPTPEQLQQDFADSGRSFIRATVIGRPTKLDDDVSGRIIAYIRQGQYVETAAAAAGISKFTFYEWLKRGAAIRGAAKPPRSELPYLAFSNAVERAMAEAEIRDVNIVGAASITQWQAAAWRLERRNPTRWGRRDRIELSGDEERPVVVESRQTLNVNVRRLSDTELEALESILEKASDPE